jgi:hypothetical protein
MLMLYLDMHRFINKVCYIHSDRTCREPTTYNEIEKLIHTNMTAIYVVAETHAIDLLHVLDR